MKMNFMSGGFSEKKIKGMKREMAQEAPERALAADIELSPEYLIQYKAREIAALEKDATVPPDKIAELKSHLNRKQAELIDQTLLAHTNREGEWGYTFKYLSQLKGLQELIKSNPYVNSADREKYAAVWNGLETQAVALFKADIETANSFYALKEEKKRAATFQFSRHDSKDTIARMIDEQAAAISDQTIENETLFYPLKELVKEIDEFPFANPAFKRSARGRIDARVRIVAEQNISRESLLYPLKSLKEEMARFPFFDPSVREGIYTSIGEQAADILIQKIHKETLLYPLKEDKKETAQFPFPDPQTREAVYAALDDKAEGIFTRDIEEEIMEYGLTASAREVAEFPFTNMAIKARLTEKIDRRLREFKKKK